MTIQQSTKKLILLPVLWGLWYLAFATRTIVAPLLPLIENELGINHAMAGGLFLFTGIGATIAVLLSGFFSVKVGFKKLIIISFLLAAGASLGIFYAKSYLILAVLLFVLGLSGGFYLPCAVPMITSIFEPAHWGKAISFHETAAGFSLLSIPFIVAYVLGFLQWRSLFIMLAASVMVVLAAFWCLSPNPQPNKAKKASLRAILTRADFWILLILWANCNIDQYGGL